MLWRMPVKGRCEPCFHKRLREKKKVMEMSKTKRYLSILLSLVLLCTTVIPMSVFAADEGAYPLEIYENGVLVSENGENPLHIQETEQKQLTVKYEGSDTIPEGKKVVWSSPTPYLVYVDENGVITGRDSSKGAILRVWVDTNIASLWLIGPSLAETIYGWFDENEIDSMDTEGIVDILEVGLGPVLGEDTTASLANSLRNTLNSINVEIRAALVDEATGEEIAYNSTHVVCDKSDKMTAEFIPNGTYITNHDAVPAQVEVGYEMDMEGITTPLRLKMDVNWKVTEKVLGLDVSTSKATIDESGHIVFNQPGTVKITATPDTEGLYNKLTELINTAGSLADAADLIGSVLKDVFGMTVAPGLIDVLVSTIKGIVEASGTDEAEALKQIISTVSDWILGVTINDSVTVEIVDQLDVTNFSIWGDLKNMSSYGGNRLVSITDIQPEGAVVKPEDVIWASSNEEIAIADNTGKVTARDGGHWGNSFTISATVDGVTASIDGNILGGNTQWPTDLKVSGPTNLNVGDTGTYDFTIYPSVLYDDGIAWDMNNIEVGLMIDGEIRYADNITDGVLYVEKGSEVDAGKSPSGQFTVTAVGGGETTLYVRAHSDSQRLGTGVSESRIVKEIKVSVYQPVAGISIAEGEAVTVEAAVTAGFANASTQLTAVVAPENATNKAVTWSSSNALVRVDENGKVSYTGLLWSPVTATITATSVDQPALTASCTVTFQKAAVHVTGVTLDQAELALYEGGSGKLTANVAPSNADDASVTWASSDPAVAAVDANGTVTAVGVGDATITVTTVDGSFTASCTVKVRADKTKLNALIEKTASFEQLEAERNAAIAVSEDEYATQAEVNAAYDALHAAYVAITGVVEVESVYITGGDERVDDMIYHKTPWYQTYKSQKAYLNIEVNDGADIASVVWEYANWSIDEPEANITPLDTDGDGIMDSAVISPNGKGIGARSCWVKVIVTDEAGNTAEDVVKVRFYNWDWQK